MKRSQSIIWLRGLVSWRLFIYFVAVHGRVLKSLARFVFTQFALHTLWGCLKSFLLHSMKCRNGSGSRIPFFLERKPAPNVCPLIAYKRPLIEWSGCSALWTPTLPRNSNSKKLHYSLPQPNSSCRPLCPLCRAQCQRVAQWTPL